MRCAKLTTLLCSTLALGCATDEAPEGEAEALSTERTEPLHLQREPVSDGSTADGSATLSFDLDGLALAASAHVDLHVQARAEGRVVQRVVVIDEDGAEISLGDVEVPALGERLRVDVTDVLNDALASGSLEIELRPIAGGAVRWSLLADEPLFRPQLVVEPLRDRFRRSPSAEADAYIVVFEDEAVARDGVDGLADALLATYGAEEEHRYRKALRGMGVVMSEASAIAMAGDPRVAYVEESTTVLPVPVRDHGLDDRRGRDEIRLADLHVHDVAAGGFERLGAGEQFHDVKRGDAGHPCGDAGTGHREASSTVIGMNLQVRQNDATAAGCGRARRGGWRPGGGVRWWGLRVRQGRGGPQRARQPQPTDPARGSVKRRVCEGVLAHG